MPLLLQISNRLIVINVRPVGPGWDKIPLPKSFLTFYKKFVLEMVVARVATPKKGNQKRGKNPLASELANTRNNYFFWYCQNAKTQREWLRMRYDEKKAFFDSNFVSIVVSLLQL